MPPPRFTDASPIGLVIPGATLPTAVLGAEPIHVFKSDPRSRVWKAGSPWGPLVIKRFEHSPLRQRVAMVLRVHPAQRERRWNSRLVRAGVPVVPVAAWGVERCRGGGRAWLAYPFLGESLMWGVREGRIDGYARRSRVTHAVASAVAALLNAGLIHRDLKSSNVMVTPDDRAYLIDVGAVRSSRSPEARWRMLADLAAALKPAWVGRAERLRFLTALTRACPDLGDPKALARVIGRIVLK
ncbi:MAG: hypothetical protein K8S99_00730 [Planctomycetes bacterium]|nr:hypothetical protein [Planctomycetota bacterium]